MSLPRWAPIGPPLVTWGATLCGCAGCVELAVLTIDGWPYCLDHGDDEAERTIARELNPGAARALLAARE